MTDQEYRDLMQLFESMREQGWDPQLCDTPVPYYDGRVPCGIPTEMGDIEQGEYLMLPRSVADLDPVFTLSVRGDSMKDAGIVSGDELRVLATPVVEDGDIVVAVVDGEYTVKSFVTDEMGQPWLVPRNKKYRPIPLTEESGALILGRVIRIHHTPRRESCVALLNVVHEEQGRIRQEASSQREETKEKEAAAPSLGSIISEAYAGLKPTSSDWIAAYWVLTTYAGAPETFTGFAAWVNALAIEAMPLCKADLLRKADVIYLKPLYRWSECVTVRQSTMERRLLIARRLKEKLAPKA